jgi:integrase
MKLKVRHGFVTPEQWRDLRARLRPELADAGDFALLTGAREMEVLALPWSDVDLEQQVIHLRATKTGQPRAIPYGLASSSLAVIASRIFISDEMDRLKVGNRWHPVVRAFSINPTKENLDRMFELANELRKEIVASVNKHAKP